MTLGLRQKFSKPVNTSESPAEYRAGHESFMKCTIHKITFAAAI
jgi:hypothetical protein